MRSELIALVHEDMDVCDLTGEKLGTVQAIASGVEAGTPSGLAQPSSRLPSAYPAAYLEVETGLFGLGKRLYVPTAAIKDVTDFVLLDLLREEIDQIGWEQRPSELEHR
jgi:hypothetical protein